MGRVDAHLEDHRAALCTRAARAVAGPSLAARLDLKLDRKTGTLVVNGFWLEEHSPDEEDASGAAFGEALGRGLARFTRLLEASRLYIAAIQPPVVRARAAATVRDAQIEVANHADD